MKIEVEMKNGRVKMLTPAQARAMVFIGKGRYLTRDMEDKPKLNKAFPGTSDQRTPEEVDAYIKSENAKLKGDELEIMGVEELRALAKQRGVAVHHKAGPEKIRAALRVAE